MSDGDLKPLPEDPIDGQRLGRHQFHSPANRLYSVKPLLAATAGDRPPKIRPYWARQIFDQKGSSCTMAMAGGLMISVPFRKDPGIKAAFKSAYGTEDQRYQAYLKAQEYDPWVGGEPVYWGTSTDAPMKMLRAAGVIKEWRWCFTFQDVLDTIRYHGPVGVGTKWLTGMDHPDAKHNDLITFTGDLRGGHAWVWEYVDEDDGLIVAVNSWGPDYGHKGRVRVKFAEAEKMLADGGEAVTIVLP